LVPLVGREREERRRGGERERERGGEERREERGEERGGSLVAY